MLMHVVLESFFRNKYIRQAFTRLAKKACLNLPCLLLSWQLSQLMDGSSWIVDICRRVISHCIFWIYYLETDNSVLLRNIYFMGLRLSNRAIRLKCRKSWAWELQQRPFKKKKKGKQKQTTTKQETVSSFRIISGIWDSENCPCFQITESS